MSADHWIININLNEKICPIHVYPESVNSAGLLIKKLNPPISKCAIITNKNIWRLYGYDLNKVFYDEGVRFYVLYIPNNENAKTLKVCSRLLNILIDNNFDRKSVLISFGGGTAGDLTGFIASIFLRGIRYIQIPTTLLAQVDSSIGGKVGINHLRGKNLIGSFKQPELVISDTNFLKSLGMRELRSGLSEIVKCAIISDENFFKKIENNIEFILNKDPEVILSIIRKCVKIKAEFIELDEKDEKGIRIALNFGHTLGHALEILDSDMRHGEAIAIGMIFAGKLSMRLGLIKKDDFTRYNELLRKICLIKNIPLIDASKIVSIMHNDKKNTSNSINFVLPTGIGKKPILKPLDEKLIISELKMQNVK